MNEYDYINKALEPHAEKIEQEIAGVRRNEDIEPLHQLRVGSRRLRSALKVFKKDLPKRNWRRWRKYLRHLGKQGSRARDLDVQIVFLQNYADQLTLASHRPIIENLRQDLQRQRDKIQPKLIAALDDFEQAGILSDIRQTVQKKCGKIKQKKPAAVERLQHLAVRRVQQCCDEIMGYEAYIACPDAGKELHQLRIAAKHLRYTLENFEALYGEDLLSFIDDIRTIQKILGELHDYDVWLQLLKPRVEQARDDTERKTLQTLVQRCQDLRTGLYNEIVAVWVEYEQSGFWYRLETCITGPLAI